MTNQTLLSTRSKPSSVRRHRVRGGRRAGRLVRRRRPGRRCRDAAAASRDWAAATWSASARTSAPARGTFGLVHLFAFDKRRPHRRPPDVRPGRATRLRLRSRPTSRRPAGPSASTWTFWACTFPATPSPSGSSWPTTGRRGSIPLRKEVPYNLVPPSAEDVAYQLDEAPPGTTMVPIGPFHHHPPRARPLRRLRRRRDDQGLRLPRLHDPPGHREALPDPGQLQRGAVRRRADLRHLRLGPRHGLRPGGRGGGRDQDRPGGPSSSGRSCSRSSASTRHLLWLGVAGHLIGYDTIFMQTWRVREPIMWLSERLTGNRKTYGMVVIGGVRRDITPALSDDILDVLKKVETEVGGRSKAPSSRTPRSTAGPRAWAASPRRRPSPGACSARWPGPAASTSTPGATIPTPPTTSCPSTSRSWTPATSGARSSSGCSRSSNRSRSSARRWTRCPRTARS